MIRANRVTSYIRSYKPGVVTTMWFLLVVMMAVLVWLRLTGQFDPLLCTPAAGQTCA